MQMKSTAASILEDTFLQQKENYFKSYMTRKQATLKPQGISN